MQMRPVAQEACIRPDCQ